MKSCDTKCYILSRIDDEEVLLEGIELESLFICHCQYCRPSLNQNKMPNRCILNGLETEAIPVELSELSILSKQLIQRAKSFQTVVRLGTYTGKVPSYNSLQACKGTMFFLPLPMKKTMVMVNGRPSKKKVVLRSFVDVNAVKKDVQN